MSSSASGPPATNPSYIVKEEDFAKLPNELSRIDWSKPVSWGKKAPAIPPPGGRHDNDDDDDRVHAAPADPREHRLFFCVFVPADFVFVGY